MNTPLENTYTKNLSYFILKKTTIILIYENFVSF